MNYIKRLCENDIIFVKNHEQYDSVILALNTKYENKMYKLMRKDRKQDSKLYDKTNYYWKFEYIDKYTDDEYVTIRYEYYIQTRRKCLICGPVHRAGCCGYDYERYDYKIKTIKIKFKHAGVYNYSGNSANRVYFVKDSNDCEYVQYYILHGEYLCNVDTAIKKVVSTCISIGFDGKLVTEHYNVWIESKIKFKKIKTNYIEFKIIYPK